MPFMENLRCLVGLRLLVGAPRSTRVDPVITLDEDDESPLRWP
jgi:hypothetical protein